MPHTCVADPHVVTQVEYLSIELYMFRIRLIPNVDLNKSGSYALIQLQL